MLSNSNGAKVAIPYMQNRELSWLQFNERCMWQAKDTTNPLIERLRFLSIFTSNLDEFFMVRVGSLVDMLPLGEDYWDDKTCQTAAEQLEAIYDVVRELYNERDQIYAELEEELRASGVYRLSYDELTNAEREYVELYFSTSILPVLSPMVIDAQHPFPHLSNKGIEICVRLHREGKTKDGFAILPIPSSIPDVLYLPGAGVRYIGIEDVLLELADVVFDTYTVLEKVQICITRNADINAEDEDSEKDKDFRNVMQRLLKDRRRLAPLRLEITTLPSKEMYKFLRKKLVLQDEQVFITSGPLKMSYAYGIEEKLSPELRRKMLYPDYEPKIPAELDLKKSMFAQIREKDRLLSYPYESMKPFIKLLEEAADDPDVVSIQITIYRLAGKSKLVKALCRAAENGVKVTVLIELRARFDEQNNIDWSREFENAGCTIMYGMPNYKVHSKLCLITRKEDNRIRRYTQVGTGNYNEKTSRLYTDLSLMTADEEIGDDASAFFRNMGMGNLEAKYDRLLVAPMELQAKVIERIDREIAKGEDGYLFFKMNSLTDKKIITKLHEASQAGVKIEMMIRGICCLIPGIPGETENIEVRSIVGRYLEHSRIYVFGKGEEQRMYIASADFMTRNTQRRVEVGCPVLDKDIQARIWKIIDLLWSDNQKAMRLLPEQRYVRVWSACATEVTDDTTNENSGNGSGSHCDAVNGKNAEGSMNVNAGANGGSGSDANTVNNPNTSLPTINAQDEQMKLAEADSVKREDSVEAAGASNKDGNAKNMDGSNAVTDNASGGTKIQKLLSWFFKN